MNYDKIDMILEKYFNGESTLEEEKLIKDFLLNTKDLPEELALLKSQFITFNDFASEKMDDSFESKIMETVLNNPIKTEPVSEENSKKTKKHTLSYFVTAIAASILILLTIWTTTGLFNKNKAAFNSKTSALAYQQATDALSILAVNFDKGLSKTQMAAKPLNTSLKMLGNVEKVNKGMEKLQPVGKLQNMEIIKINK